MIRNVETVWLHSFSAQVGQERKAYLTIFVEKEQGGPQALMATTALSYLTSLDNAGAGTLIKDVRTVSGGLQVFTDFANNSIIELDVISLTWGLSCNGAQAFAQGNLFYLSVGTKENAAVPETGDAAGEGVGREAAPGRRIEPEAAVAIYRRTDGIVLATHCFGVGAGSKLPDEAALHAAALANAVGEKLGEEDALGLLPVDPARLERGVGYRVRTETGELEAEAKAD